MGLSLLYRFVSWPRRQWRLMHNNCPWCGRALMQLQLQGGPLQLHSGCARYCSSYHFFASDRTFVRADVGGRQQFYLIRSRVEDAHGKIPVEIREIIDGLVYALHRVVLHDQLDEAQYQEYHDEAMDRAVQSCNRLVDKLLRS